MDTRTIVALHRLANPRSRVVDLFQFHQNGSTVRSMRCILCGTEGPTWCGKWPKTVKATMWEITHYSKHQAQFEAQAGLL